MDQTNPNPVPTVAKTTPKDVFLHLLATVTLYASAVSFITLMFLLIDAWMGVNKAYNYGQSDSIRWAASMLIVMFPVYLIVSWIINRGFAAHPERREIKVRKWLGYLTLFISAITFIVDVVVLVYNLLGGEKETVFFLKVLVVLAVAAIVFLYYFFDLKKAKEGAVV